MLKVSVAAGESGPVLVLAGEADVTSITRLDRALTAQISGQAVRLIIDATNLRYVDAASMRALVTAARKVRTRGGSVTLLNPHPPVARMLALLCADQMFSIRGQLPRRGPACAPAAPPRLVHPVPDSELA